MTPFLYLLTTAVALPFLFVAAIHLGYRAPRHRERTNPRDGWDLDYRAAYLPGPHGKRLYSWLLPVPYRNAPVLIVMHGWGGNMEFMMPVAIPFHRAGFNVLLLDARNHGSSDADGFSALPRFAEDVESAVDWVRTRFTGKIALLGHSVGAAAVLLAASRRRDIDAVISIAAFAHPKWLMQRQLQRLHLPGPLIRLGLQYIEWRIGHRYDDIAPMNTVCRIHCPVLLAHGTADRTVPVEDLHQIAENCPRGPLTLLEIPGAGHQSVESVDRYNDLLIAFLRRAGLAAKESAK